MDRVGHAQVFLCFLFNRLGYLWSWRDAGQLEGRWIIAAHNKYVPGVATKLVDPVLSHVVVICGQADEQRGAESGYCAVAGQLAGQTPECTIHSRNLGMRGNDDHAPLLWIIARFGTAPRLNGGAGNRL